MPRKPNTNGDHYFDPFPSRLRELMRKKNARQVDLSEVLDLGTRQAVARYTDGTASPTGDKISALADYFGVSTDYLLGRTDIETPNSDIQTICEYTGLDEKAVNMLHGYNTTHEDHSFNRKALNVILGNAELYAVLKATARAIKAAEIWEASEGKPVTSETEFTLLDKKMGSVIVPAAIAEDFFTRYAEEELHYIVRDVVKACTNDTERESEDE